MKHDLDISHCRGYRFLAPCHVAIGRTHNEINRYAESCRADLIVMGKGGETERQEALKGSVVKHVLYETGADILLVDPAH